jgi:hypothetical protein
MPVARYDPAVMQRPESADHPTPGLAGSDDEQSPDDGRSVGRKAGERTRRAWWLGASVVLLPLLAVGFLNDDFVGLMHFGPQGWAGVLDQFHPRGFEFLRPFGFVLFRSELSLFGPRPFLFHLTHLALFVLAAALAGRLAARLCDRATAGWAATLALVYPGRIEVVAWIAALFDLLSLLLTSAALLLAAAPGWDGRRGRFAGLAALCFAAPLAKESAYAIPLVILAWELLGVLGPAARATRVLRCAASFAGASASFALRLVVLGGIGGYRGVPIASAASKLAKLPEMLARIAFAPVNPTYGRASEILVAGCAVAALGAVVALIRGRWRQGWRPVAAGLVLAVAGLLPALPYLDPGSLTWHQSRFVALSGLGLALAAAAAIAHAPRRWSVLAAALLLVAWTSTTVLNELPWLGAARCRDALLAKIDQDTRSPGPHWVWVAGPINGYRGAQLVGGRLAEAVHQALPGRVVHVDSEFLQTLEGRTVGPPPGVPRGALHLLRFEASTLRVVEIERPPVEREPRSSR